MEINAEDLAYWYLRLNGFLSIQNFVVHPDQGRNQETDVDLMAVRFPFRAENLTRPMKDDKYFIRHKTPYIVFAEVKAGRCSLNGPWTKPERGNMKRVLNALGAFTEKENDRIANELHRSGFFQNQFYRVSLLCIGAEKNINIEEDFPEIPQILWAGILQFIFRRFRDYKNQKVSHVQWDETGTLLWKKSVEFRRSEDDFCNYFKII